MALAVVRLSALPNTALGRVTEGWVRSGVTLLKRCSSEQVLGCRVTYDGFIFKINAQLPGTRAGGFQKKEITNGGSSLIIVETVTCLGVAKHFIIYLLELPWLLRPPPTARPVWSCRVRRSDQASGCCPVAARRYLLRGCDLQLATVLLPTLLSRNERALFIR